MVKKIRGSIHINGLFESAWFVLVRWCNSRYNNSYIDRKVLNNYESVHFWDISLSHNADILVPLIVREKLSETRTCNETRERAILNFMLNSLCKTLCWGNARVMHGSTSLNFSLTLSRPVKKKRSFIIRILKLKLYESSLKRVSDLLRCLSCETTIITGCSCKGDSTVCIMDL